MDDTQSNAPACADSGASPDTSSHAGVIHVRTRLTSGFTVLANALAQRPGSAVTVGVAAYLLSLPDGARVSIAALCAHFAEGEILISRALRELEAEGYVERRRVHLPSGHFRTRTYVHDVPPEAVREAAGRPHAETRRHRTEGTPGPRTERLPGSGTGRRSRPVPPKPRGPGGTRRPTPPPEAGRGQDQPQAPERAQAPDRPHTSEHPHTPEHPHVPDRPHAPGRPHAVGSAPVGPRDPVSLADIAPEALAVLTSLRRLDPRLVLSEREAASLAPAITRWLATGIGRARLADTLTTGLPDHFRARPAALLAFRLKETPLPAPPRRTPDPDPLRPHPFQTCDSCDRVFRAAAPGHCRDCRESRDRREGRRLSATA
ncbi:translation initiation factor IF-2 [Streptomyces sp. SID11385]|uniref:translation initiation factor IF-2 n=1 Tax=Streptomyces sp. SID11385 TaxID=2706031 RepID=UPI0013C9E8A9|nr:translation initiation factor IF-2 [Streptomyces sp. SID11385]NEA43143.1 translation initiation factor IF-2 [Streptomyces sp. SID11385]